MAFLALESWNCKCSSENFHCTVHAIMTNLKNENYEFVIIVRKLNLGFKKQVRMRVTGTATILKKIISQFWRRSILQFWWQKNYNFWENVTALQKHEIIYRYQKF